MHARIAKYSFSGDGMEIARRAEEGMLPIFRATPGFKGYTVVEAGDEVFSFSAWDSSEAADAANAAAAQWVAENLADRVELKKSWIGEIHFSTPLGVTTKAGAATG
jgi:heme-degrading monooxygenase HmoA